jgi:hypothetical protein
LADKPVLLCVSWEDDDHEAIVVIMPADAKPENEDKPFETFTHATNPAISGACVEIRRKREARSASRAGRAFAYPL